MRVSAELDGTCGAEQWKGSAQWMCSNDRQKCCVTCVTSRFRVGIATEEKGKPGEMMRRTKRAMRDVTREAG